MDSVVIFGTNLFYLLLAWGFVIAMLRLFDRSNNVSFSRDFLPKLQENPNALGIYLAGRIVAVAITVAAAL